MSGHQGHSQGGYDANGQPYYGDQQAPGAHHGQAQASGMYMCLGPYELRRELGRGGMGIVYEAFHTELQRRCALKTINVQWSGPEGASRFVREAQSSARITKHPHIVQVFDAGEIGGIPYIAMEYVEGHSLAALVNANGVLPEHVMLDIGRKVALALAHAHGHGIVHRDMKPENVIVDAAGEPHVLDFGLAKDVRADQTLSSAGSVVGTPAYMPPEQMDAAMGTIDARTDVYALAATLYHVACGQAVFHADSYGGMLQRMLTERAVPLHKLARVSKDFSAVIQMALERDQNDRYDSALAFADDISRVTAGEVPEARSMGPVGRSLRLAARHAALVTVVCLLTLFCVVGLSYSQTRMAELQQGWQAQASHVAVAASTELRRLLEPVVPVLRERVARAQEGNLEVADPRALSAALSYPMRFSSMEKFYFGDENTGRFTGVVRDSESRLWVRANWLTGKLGPLQNAQMGEGGEVSELQPPAEQAVYDPRERDWYGRALNDKGVVWTSPYRFKTGEVGITLAQAVRGEEAVVSGVFGVDFSLAGISAFLQKQDLGRGGEAYLLTADRELLAATLAHAAASLPAHVRPVVKAALGLETEGGQTHLSYYTFEGVEYVAAVRPFMVEGDLALRAVVVIAVDKLRGALDDTLHALVIAAALGLALIIAIGIGAAFVRRRRIRARMGI